MHISKAHVTDIIHTHLLNSLHLINNCESGLNILIENQQMHQNDHFVMSSQTLLHVTVY
jgi:hypothetical protein